MLGGLVSIAFSWMQSYEQLALFRFLSGGFCLGVYVWGAFVLDPDYFFFKFDQINSAKFTNAE
jgi:hypothetical protein